MPETQPVATSAEFSMVATYVLMTVFAEIWGMRLRNSLTNHCNIGVANGLRHFGSYVRAATTLAALLLSSPCSYAVSERAQQACKADYYQHCSQYSVGTEELRQCMRKVGEGLSTPCLAALAQDGEITKADVERYRATHKEGATPAVALPNVGKNQEPNAANAKHDGRDNQNVAKGNKAKAAKASKAAGSAKSSNTNKPSKIASKETSGKKGKIGKEAKSKKEANSKKAKSANKSKEIKLAGAATKVTAKAETGGGAGNAKNADKIKKAGKIKKAATIKKADKVKRAEKIKKTDKVKKAGKVKKADKTTKASKAAKASSAKKTAKANKTAAKAKTSAKLSPAKKVPQRN